MDFTAPQGISFLVEKFGHSVFENRRKLKGFLMDYCGHHPNEINLLLHGFDEKVPFILLNPDKNGSLAFVQEKLVCQLEKKLFLTRNAASWTVETWGFALGVLPIKEPEKKKECIPKKRVRKKNKQRSSPPFWFSFLGWIGVGDDYPTLDLEEINFIRVFILIFGIGFVIFCTLPKQQIFTKINYLFIFIPSFFTFVVVFFLGFKGLFKLGFWSIVFGIALHKTLIAFL